MAERYSFLVIGSGFGGSIMSMVLRRLGKSVLMIERGRHPRFAIGESSTPFANLLLEKLAQQFDLPFLRELSEWGSWQKKHPQISCGLKRGFTFFHHRFGEATDFTHRSSQLLVAASPNDDVADTNWYRPEFDQFLARKAEETGVCHLEDTRIESISRCDDRGGEWCISVSTQGQRREIRGEFIIDAAGPQSVLGQNLQIPREPFAAMPPTAGVWAHFRNVLLVDQLPVFRGIEMPPYPFDDAAVHHVFPGGWIWILRFNNGITSAGAAYTTDSRFVGTTPEETWRNLLNELPTVGELLRESSTVTPFYSTPELSFRRGRIAGNGWAMLPSAAGFVDPLLSTGFALNLLGILRLAEHFTGVDMPIERYQEQTDLELEAAADLISALYAKMNSPEEFNWLTLLYFAALSFTETAWRLNKRELATAFLLADSPEFSDRRARLCAFARQGKTIVRDDVQQAIAPFDIAGLTDFKRKNWYPVDLRDLINNAHKLQASTHDLQALLEKLRLPWPIEDAEVGALLVDRTTAEVPFGK